jgi:hypothetical protein
LPYFNFVGPSSCVQIISDEMPLTKFQEARTEGSNNEVLPVVFRS